MARKASKKNQQPGSGAVTGYENKLWEMADALRGSMDAAEYKHVVLGLIFLKYISDAFEERHAQLEAERAEGADPEGPVGTFRTHAIRDGTPNHGCWSPQN